MKRITAIAVTLFFSLSTTPKAQANPAILAPAAFCAGTAGVGCVLVGTALVGGSVYYVWQLSNGKKVHATAQGQVAKLEVWDTKKENRHTVYGDEDTCRQMGKRRGFGRMLPPVKHDDGTITCRFVGKQTSFGGGN